MRTPEIRRSLIDGLTRFGPLPLILAMATIAALVVAFGATRLFAELVCIFELPQAARAHPRGCAAYALSHAPPGRMFAGALIFSLVYLGLHRLSIGRRWFLEYDDRLQLHPAHIFTILTGPSLGSAFLTGLAPLHSGDSLGLGWLFIVCVGPLTALVLGSVRALATWAVVRYARDRAAAWTLRQHLDRRLRGDVARDLRVRVEKGRASIVGPFDEIDVHRIRDIAATEFAEWIDEIEIETTLEPDEYARYRTAALGPSGYKSPPIRPAREVPLGWLLGAFLAGLLFLGLMLYYGGILSWEEFANKVKDAVTQMGHRLPELSEMDGPAAQAPGSAPPRSAP